ncbi:NAD-dependent epimerase/dehydratase family protein [Treponema sp. UBA3813]|uniref:NAD-dependent epimerase/dehydratase family protein n=1 Tax=Treponema sp. UBA3813 TaxID=1947715 RepID=UPI0025D37090|nr:NAD-dependent epimerase/dehydratase family protein [Treponema sp. UBA3813]
MKKLILTGATGMIGSAIVHEALKQDYDITCIVRKNSSRIKNIPQDSRVHIIDADISEYKNLELKKNTTYSCTSHGTKLLLVDEMM